MEDKKITSSYNLPWCSVGLDESNNGFEKGKPKLPAIYFAVASNMPEDITFNSPLLGKFRRNHNGIKAQLESRDYSFLLITKSELSSIPKNKKIGFIVGSLLYNQPFLEHLDIYLDGEFNEKTIDYTRGILHEITFLEKELINIHCGEDYDRRIKLVNIADEAAH